MLNAWVSSSMMRMSGRDGIELMLWSGCAKVTVSIDEVNAQTLARVKTIYCLVSGCWRKYREDCMVSNKLRVRLGWVLDLHRKNPLYEKNSEPTERTPNQPMLPPLLTPANSRCFFVPKRARWRLGAKLSNGFHQADLMSFFGNIPVHIYEPSLPLF
jgi:hypothetical protein